MSKATLAPRPLALVMRSNTNDEQPPNENHYYSLASSSYLGEIGEADGLRNFHNNNVTPSVNYWTINDSFTEGYGPVYTDPAGLVNIHPGISHNHQSDVFAHDTSITVDAPAIDSPPQNGPNLNEALMGGNTLFTEGQDTFLPGWTNSNAPFAQNYLNVPQFEMNLLPTPLPNMGNGGLAYASPIAVDTGTSNQRYLCTNIFCTKTFGRDADRIRHEESKHSGQTGLHLCPVLDCSKNQGQGFCRADKVKEHCWKKHAN